MIEGSGDVVAAVIALLVRERIVPEQTRVEQSTLDDAFVALTAEADAELHGQPRGGHDERIGSDPGTTSRRSSGAAASRAWSSPSSSCFAREPMILFWALLFPVGLLIVLGLERLEQAAGGVRRPRASSSSTRRC